MATWGRDVFTLYLGGATGGTFTLGDGTTNTAAIAHNASAATIETELETIYGAGNVTVAADTDFTITFAASVGVSGLVANFASLTGATSPALTLTDGATEVNIKANNTYRPPEAHVIFNDIPILPDPSTPTVPASIMQQGGTGRKRVRWEGFVESVTDYNTLQADKIAGTVRTFTGPSSETLTGHIEFLQIIGYTVLDFLEYSIVIVEE